MLTITGIEEVDAGGLELPSQLRNDVSLRRILQLDSIPPPQRLILLWFAEFGAMKTETLAAMLQVQSRMVRNYLAWLVDRQFLIERGSTSNREHEINRPFVMSSPLCDAILKVVNSYAATIGVNKNTTIRQPIAEPIRHSIAELPNIRQPIAELRQPIAEHSAIQCLLLEEEEEVVVEGVRNGTRKSSRIERTATDTVLHHHSGNTFTVSAATVELIADGRPGVSQRRVHNAIGELLKDWGDKSWKQIPYKKRTLEFISGCHKLIDSATPQTATQPDLPLAPEPSPAPKQQPQTVVVYEERHHGRGKGTGFGSQAEWKARPAHKFYCKFATVELSNAERDALVREAGNDMAADERIAAAILIVDQKLTGGASPGKLNILNLIRTEAGLKVHKPKTKDQLDQEAMRAEIERAKQSGL